MNAKDVIAVVDGYELDGVEFDVVWDGGWSFAFTSDLGSDDKSYRSASDAAQAAQDWIRAHNKD